MGNCFRGFKGCGEDLAKLEYTSKRERDGMQISNQAWEDKTGHWTEVSRIKNLQKPSPHPQVNGGELSSDPVHPGVTLTPTITFLH